MTHQPANSRVELTTATAMTRMLDSHRLAEARERQALSDLDTWLDRERKAITERAEYIAREQKRMARYQLPTPTPPCPA